MQSLRRSNMGVGVDQRQAEATTIDTEERAAHLRRHPLCVRCLAQGRVTAASVLDHIIPIRAAPEKQHDPSNHQSLCAEHHREKTLEDMKNYPEHY